MTKRFDPNAVHPERESIDARRAATLIGMSLRELLLLSRLNGCGRLVASGADGGDAEMVFTYEDLRRLALLAAPSQE